MAAKTWTAEMDKMLTDMWASRDIFAIDIGFEIGRVIGRYVSKNAVIGRAHRLKLKLRGVEIFRAKKAQLTPAEAAKKRERKTFLERTRKHMKRELDPDLPVVPPLSREEVWLPLDSFIPIEEAHDKYCRWPVNVSGAWDEKADGYCGHPVGRGVYCPQHTAIAFKAEPVRSAVKSYGDWK